MSGFVLESPFYLLLLCLPAAVLVAWWWYYRNKSHESLSRTTKFLLFSLRAATLFVALLLLLNIVIKTTRTEAQPSLVLVATDNSASITTTKDSAAIRASITQLLAKLEAAGEDHFSLRFIQFGASAETSTNPPTFREKETDFSQLFHSISDNYANQNIGALVVISDGIYNKGLNPLYAINDFHFPLFTIGTGDTTIKKDARIRKVDYNEVVTAGNDFLVEAAIEASACKDETLTLALLQNGKTISEKSVKVSSAAFFQPVSFTVATQNPGLLRYELKLLAPANDANLGNNVFPFAVEALDNKEKILVIAHSPHPDLAALRDLLESTGHYEVEWRTMPTALPKANAWSLVLFHGFNLDDFSYLTQCRDAQVPVFIINPRVADLAPIFRLQGDATRTNESESAYNSSFTLFNLSDEAKRFASSLPAMLVPLGTIRYSPSAEALLFQKIGSIETSNPVFLFSNEGQQKSSVIIGDGLWRWKIRDYQENASFANFREIMGKAIQWLVLKNDKNPFRIQPPRLINETESVVFSAEVYNESYELITDPDVSLTIRDEQNRNYPYAFSKQNGRYYLDAGGFAPGSYSYTAKVPLKNGVQTRTGTFIVNAVNAELSRLDADHQLLRQLALKTNGQFFTLQNGEAVIPLLKQSDTIKKINYTEHTTEPLIELRWLFWTLLVLLTIEWFIRKHYLPI